MTTARPRQVTELSGLDPDFEDLLEALRGERVEFLIVGAYAVAFHGARRRTSDLDILIRPSWDNAAAVARALYRCGAPVNPAKLTVANIARSGIVYHLTYPARGVDLLTEISGLSFDEAWRSRATARVRSRRVHVIGWEALLHNKRVTGRAKDLADVERLEAIACVDSRLAFAG